jgi:hypothetical protein
LIPYDASIFGYFSNPSGPADYDPPLTVRCPGCGQPVGSEGIRTVSFMLPGSGRSWFYRGHKPCLTDEMMSRVEATIIDAMALKIGDAPVTGKEDSR